MGTATGAPTGKCEPSQGHLPLLKSQETRLPVLLWQSRRGAGGHRSLCPQGIPASENLQRARQGGAAAVSSCLYTLLTQDTKLHREITAVFKHSGFNTAIVGLR